MATIKEIAQRANVSSATVSHVINNTRFVSDEVRGRVEAAVQALGYVPNALARSLRKRDTRTLGMMIPDIGNAFFAELVRAVEDECYRQGYSLVLCNTDDDPARQVAYLQTLMAKRVDGLVLIAAGRDAELARLLHASWLPLVVVDREIEGVAGDLVEVDHEQGGYLAATHLLSLGHRRIAVIAGPSGLAVSRQRVAGCVRALREAGVALPAEHLVHADFTTEGGHGAAAALLALRHRPTAIFACNDLSALGAIHAARAARLRVPDDLSVVGFDDIALAAFVSPRLTTIRQPKQRIGALAAQLLIARVAGQRTDAVRKILPPELEPGATTAPPAVLLADAVAPMRAARATRKRA
ncbi:MAG: LacI family DNA-binding transcriptional regulator [Burkholderiales bacterium]